LRLEYVVRSKLVAGGHRFHGLYPFKHVGIRVTEDSGAEVVYHLQTDKGGPFGKIRIDECTTDEFASYLGIKVIKWEEVDYDFVAKAIKRMYDFSGKYYIPVFRDCDCVVNAAYYGRLGSINRQLLIALSLCAYAFALKEGFNNAAHRWDPQHPIINYTVVTVATLYFVWLVLKFFLRDNNTTASTSNLGAKRPE